MAVTVCPRAGDHPGRCLRPPPPATNHRSLSGKGPVSEEVPEPLAGDTGPVHTAPLLPRRPRGLAPDAVLAVGRRGPAPGGARQEVEQQERLHRPAHGGGQKGRGQRSRPENTEPRRLEPQGSAATAPTARTTSLGP